MMTNDFNKWFNIIMLICIVLSLTMGFAIGYIYKMKDCSGNPLIEGIKKINKENDADFTCSCISTKIGMVTFTFDKENISEGKFWYNR